MLHLNFHQQTRSKKVRNKFILVLISFGLVLLGSNSSFSGSESRMFNFFKKSPPELTPVKQQLSIPISTFNDGKAHHFRVKSANGTMVTFFALKSKDGVIRAAIDACDVCYRAGKGYVQEGDNMVCQNCGQKFASNKINIIRGGCNPAPLNRQIVGNNLVILMDDINTNSWYCEFKS